MLCLQGQNAQGLHMDSAAVEQLIDLRPYMNTSPTPIPETFSLDRAYRMFTQLGLRHLVVVDPHNHVKGIVTRKVCPEATACSRVASEKGSSCAGHATCTCSGASGTWW